MAKELSRELARIFEEEFGKVIKRELAEEEYLPQSEFETCEARAAAGLEIATERVRKVLARAIIHHREHEHEESHAKEKASLESQMEPEDVAIGVMSWWNT